MFEDLSRQPIWSNDKIWKGIALARIEYINSLYLKSKEKSNDTTSELQEAPKTEAPAKKASSLSAFTVSGLKQESSKDSK